MSRAFGTISGGSVRAAGLTRAGRKCASDAAVGRSESVGLVADMGVAGETNDGVIRAGVGVGDRRYRLPQARGAFGGSGAAIFRDVGQSRQLPSCREGAPCGRG